MLADFFRTLTGSQEPHRMTPNDSRLAMAVLMVRLARADENYNMREKEQIDQFLADHYRLDQAEVERIRAEAEIIETDAPDTVQFTRIIKDTVSYEDRADVVEALWRVAATDGIDAEERGFLRLVVNLLGVSDQDSGLARQRAQATLKS